MKKDNFRWLLIIAVVVVATATTTNMMAFAPILGDIAKDLGISIPVAQASFLGIFVFVVAISTLVSGTLADRFGVMAVMILALVVTTIPSILFSVAGKNLSILMAFRVAQGFGAGAIFAAIPLVAAAWFSEEEKGFAVGVGMTGVNGGMMIGVAVAPIINQITANWRTTMSWIGYVDFVVLLYVIFLTVQYKKHTPLNHTIHTQNGEASNSAIKEALTNPRTWVGIIMCMLISWLLNALNDLTPQYFALPIPMGVGFGSVVAGRLMLLVQVGTVVGSLLSGIVIDKVFKGNTKPVLIIGFVCTAACVYPILFSVVYNNLTVLMILLFLAGTFVAFLNPAASTFVAQVYPEHVVGRVVGLWLGIGAFGGSLGVFVGALALHKTGNYHLTITLFAIVAMIALILSRIIGLKKSGGEVSVEN
ncbi:MFS transporter [Clostridium sp. PL3]|uniref:MFS transporter n=1 Tax=Clostridium thailandense TaxID=2794346 RepID=A0A949TP63_9CLOT|nr:MFS transporter [Clostridium thailandense]MBV7276429.1 MFS transporter [Clostridium thailandense]